MKRLLDKIRKVCSLGSGHGRLRRIQVDAPADARLAGDYADKSWLRMPFEYARKHARAMEVLGTKHVLHSASTFKAEPPAVTVPNLAARRSALQQ